MKTSSRDLYDLIKAMTKSEKGYFKKHANLTGGDKVYLRLFDAIDEQKKYDESRIKEKFKGEQFIKQISVAKNNLYAQILKSLNQSSAGSNNRFELRANTVNAEILFNKGLSNQALKMISRLKVQAYEIEEFDALLPLINLQKSILVKSFADNESTLEEIYREELEIITKRKNYVHYQKLFNKSYYLITKFGHIRNKAEEKQYNEILNSEYMKNEKLADSTMSAIHFHEIFLYYFVSKMEFAEALKRTTKCLGLIEASPALMAAHMDKYLSLYQNHILQYFYLNRYAETESNSQKLLAMLNDKKMKIPERVKVTCIGKLLCIRFVAFINSADFNMALKVFNETKEYISNYNEIIDNSITIVLLNLSSYYNFAAGNYAEALLWINKLLNNSQLKYFIEMSCNAKWFELLIHYELKNYDYIDDILKTNKRYINKKEKIFGIEKLMIRFFARAIDKLENEKELLKELLFNLNKAAASADYGIDYYNITAWTKSKIEKVPLKTFLEKK